MTILRYISIFLLVTLLGYGQVPQQHRRIELPIQAEIPVRGLYRRLVSQQIEGFPTPKRMKVLSLYLSNSLIHRINQARACHDDWFRLHPKNDEAYNARMASLYREVVLKEKPVVAEGGFIPLGALTPKNGNGHAAETKPEVAEPVAGD